MSSTSTTDNGIIDIKQARHRAAQAKPTRALRELLDANDTDALESMVMSKLEAPPLDEDFFLMLFAGLVKRNEAGTAEIYVQLLLESIEHRDAFDAIPLLCALLMFWPDCTPARTLLTTLVRAQYNNSPNFEALAEHFGLAQTTAPLNTLQKMEGWLCYDEGHAVYSPAFGVGQVKDINLSLNKIRVAFQNQAGKLESFRIDTARKLLQPLAADHFLARKLRDPDELAQLAQGDPGELLRQVFAGERRALNTTELKQMLDGIVPASSWTSWWSKARQDSRLTVGTGTRPSITWAESAEQAEEGIRQEFEAASPSQKIELALKHAGRSDELTATIIGTLSDLSQSMTQKDPALALTMALAVEKLGAPSETLESFARRDDIATLIPAIQDRTLRRRAQTLLRELRDDWQGLYTTLLSVESDNQALAQMYESLRDQGGAEQLTQLVNTILNTPANAPHLYLWLCKELGEREELTRLVNWPFLQALLAALANPALKAQHAALRKLFDPGSVVDIAVKALSEEQAAALLALLEKGPALEDYRRDSLKSYVLECNPALRSDKKEELFTTAEALEAKTAEFKKLLREDIPANTEAMKKAKEHGDLRENFEYHAARARQEMLSSRAKTLQDQLTCAHVLDPAAIDTSAVAVGTTITLRPTDTRKEELILTILGPWDSHPEVNIVSYQAAAVAALLGSRQGDVVTYDSVQYTIEAIKPWR